MHRPCSRVSLVALFVAIGAIVIAIVTAVEAVAHHPGSHAQRRSDGQVRVEIAALASDACTTIDTVARGAPAGVKPPPESEPVTVTLKRPGAAVCVQAVAALRHEVVLPLPAGARTLHLYIVGADGRVGATERVPVR